MDENEIEGEKNNDEETMPSEKKSAVLSNVTVSKNKLKTGVVYLSFIPPYMNADTLRRMLSKYAPIGRIFIQVVREPGEKRARKSKEDMMYEGWVEFQKKRHAKQIAGMLNNTKMGGKKKSRFYDSLWNLKYLPRFKWVHLMERLNYEKAVMRQKLRTEISQAKRVANHFKEAVETQDYINRKNKFKNKGEPMEVLSSVPDSTSLKSSERFKQKISIDDSNKKIAEEKRENFLRSIFS